MIQMALSSSQHLHISNFFKVRVVDEAHKITPVIDVSSALQNIVPGPSQLEDYYSCSSCSAALALRFRGRFHEPVRSFPSPFWFTLPIKETYNLFHCHKGDDHQSWPHYLLLYFTVSGFWQISTISTVDSLFEVSSLMIKKTVLFCWLIMGFFPVIAFEQPTQNF